MDLYIRNTILVFTGSWVTTVVLTLVYVTESFHSSVLLTVICILGAITTFIMMYIIAYFVSNRRDNRRNRLSSLQTGTQVQVRASTTVQDSTIASHHASAIDPSINEYRLSIDDDQLDKVAVGVDNEDTTAHKIIIIENP